MSAWADPDAGVQIVETSPHCLLGGGIGYLHDQARVDEGEGEHRQGQVLECQPERREVTGQERVDGQQAGDPVRRCGETETADGRREDSPRVGEQEGEDQRQPEVGNGPGEHGVAEYHLALTPHAPPGHGETERDSQHERDEHGQGDQFERGRGPLDEILDDRSPGRDGVTQVASRQVGQERPELDGQGLVKPQVATDGGQDPLAGGGPGNNSGGISRDQADEEESCRRRPDQLDDHEAGPTNDQAAQPP